MSFAYTVRTGDSLSSIAMAHGLRSWQELYQHPDNASFRARRPNPDRIYPGDIVMIPDRARQLASAAAPPPWLLAAIDGTCSADWRDKKDGSNSHVFKFHRDFKTPTDRKHYQDGPGTLGLEVNSIVEDVCGFIRMGLRELPAARIALVGHSRGGLIVVLAARQLEVPIHYVGLYDAVDRHFGASASVVPGNVRVARHALRDPSVHSRVYFGNCARRHEPSVDYLEEKFLATHGGIGGAPEGGKNELRDDILLTAAATAAGGPVVGALTWNEVACRIDVETDKQGAKAADRWIRDSARSQGLPI